MFGQKKIDKAYRSGFIDGMRYARRFLVITYFMGYDQYTETEIRKVLWSIGDALDSDIKERMQDERNDI